MSFRERIKEKWKKLCTTDNIIDLSVDAFYTTRRCINFTNTDYCKVSETRCEYIFCRENKKSNQMVCS